MRLAKHDFRLKREYCFRHQLRDCLAIVDLDSYPPFVDAGADRLDLLRHLCLQGQALTAMMWETSEARLNLRFVLALDHREAGDLGGSGHRVFADGWVRTGGRLCLVGQDRLLDSAGHRKRDLLYERRAAGLSSARVLLVPPGIYAVTVFSGPGGAAANYNVVLRHHPHPAPRLQPVRLSGLAPTESFLPGGKVISSHARDYNFR